MRQRINRYLLAYLALAVVPIVFISAAAFIYARRVLTHQALTQLDTIATLEEQRIEDYLENNNELMSSFISRSRLQALLDQYAKGNPAAPGELGAILAESKNDTTKFSELRAIDNRGTIIASTATGEQAMAYPYFADIDPSRATPKLLIKKQPDGKLSTILVARVIQNDAVLGFIVINTDPDNFNALTTERQGLGQSGEMYLAQRTRNGDALALTQYRYEQPGSQLVFVTDKSEESKPIIRALQNKEATYTDTIDYRDVPVLAATRYIPDQDWGLVVKIDKSEVYAPLNNFGISLIVLVLLVMLIAAYASLLLYKKERTLNRAKDEFVSLASHQLRTPASKVKVLTGMMLEGFEGKLTRQQRAALRNVYKTNNEQLDIINNLLRVVRFDSGKVNLKIEPVNLCDLVRKVVKEISAVIEERQQTLKLKLPARPVTVMADPLSIEMVIENLLSNATKYTPEFGRIWLTVGRRGNTALLTVKDSGVGISKRDQKRLFHKFSRLDNPLSTKVGGTGVGLYLSHKIIALHKGRLRVLSRPKKGSTFTVELALADAKTAASNAGASVAPPAGARFSAK